MPKTKSNKYAIIQLQGKQFKVSEGDLLEVDQLDLKDNDKLEVTDVLLVADGDKIQVGTPLVAKAKVTCKVVNSYKGKKIRVATYKAKSRYRRVKGFRPSYTKLEVVKIA